MSKYQRLSEHFHGIFGRSWHATFEEIERIVGFTLPASARTYPAWWANTADNTPQKAAWLDAGWRTRDLNLSAGHVLFVREAGSTAQPSARSPTRSAAAPRHTSGPPHEWDEGVGVEFRIGLAWVPIGRVVLDAAGRLAFPPADAAPAIYRFRIRHGDAETRYIGQTDNLARRFGNYRNPGPGQQTNVRLNAEFLRSLSAGAEIAVAAVTGGAWIELESGRAAADMSSLAVRCLLENAAILADAAVGVESLNRSEAIVVGSV